MESLGLQEGGKRGREGGREREGGKEGRRKGEGKEDGEKMSQSVLLLLSFSSVDFGALLIKICISKLSSGNKTVIDSERKTDFIQQRPPKPQRSNHTPTQWDLVTCHNLLISKYMISCKGQVSAMLLYTTSLLS